jgi:hypothetical protein
MVVSTFIIIIMLPIKPVSTFKVVSSRVLEKLTKIQQKPSLECRGQVTLLACQALRALHARCISLLVIAAALQPAFWYQLV